MQAISGLSSSLGCTDCKTNFSSASLLLKHFAEHISSNAAREGSTESESEDTRSESILERALRSPASLSSSSVPDASSPTTILDDTRKPGMDDQTNEVTITNNEGKVPILFELTKRKNHVVINNNNNNNNSKNVMYVKLDLQKRVENCVLQLTDSSESTSEEYAIGIKSESIDDNIGEIEEFNPLKFCVVTLEEGSEKLELNDTPRNNNNNHKSSAVVNNGHTDPQQQYKKYVCTYCFKRFGWSTDLKRHILTHTGERPFQCQLCGATFTRNFLLQKHVNKLHKSQVVTEQKEATSMSISDPINNVTEVKLKTSATTIETLPTDLSLKDSSSSILPKRRRQGIIAEANNT